MGVPSITDPLDPDFSTQGWVQADKVNTTDGGGNFDIPEDSLLHQSKPTAEVLNGICEALQNLSDFAIEVDGSGAANDGAALSVFGVTGSSTAPRADIAAGTQGHTLRRNSNALTFGTLVAGSFATGPGIVTPGMMDNGSARSVLGRSANSSGARADISGSGTAALNRVLSDNGTTSDWRPIQSLTGWDTLYEVDFSSLATNDFANGTESIDGLSWTVAGRAGANAFGVVNGQGIVWSINTSSAQSWTVAAPNAPHLYLPVSSIPNWTGGYPIIVDLYISSATFENGNDAVRVGLWDVASSPAAGSTTNRCRAADRANHGGTQTVRTFDGTTATQAPDAWNVNAYSIRIEMNNTLSLGVGTYSGGWPQFSHVWRLDTALATDETLNASTARLLIAVINASDASPTTTATIARMRVRRG